MLSSSSKEEKGAGGADPSEVVVEGKKLNEEEAITLEPPKETEEEAKAAMEEQVAAERTFLEKQESARPTGQGSARPTGEDEAAAPEMAESIVAHGGDSPRTYTEADASEAAAPAASRPVSSRPPAMILGTERREIRDADAQLTDRKTNAKEERPGRASKRLQKTGRRRSAGYEGGGRDAHSKQWRCVRRWRA